MPYTKKFRKLLENVEEHYAGKAVPKEYQEKYGKIYSEQEAKSIAFAIARKKHWRI